MVAISYSIMSAGWLFEAKKSAKWVEMLRLFIVGFIVFTFFRNASFKMAMAISVFVVVTFSLIWLIQFYVPTFPHERQTRFA